MVVYSRETLLKVVSFPERFSSISRAAAVNYNLGDFKETQTNASPDRNVHVSASDISSSSSPRAPVGEVTAVGRSRLMSAGHGHELDSIHEIRHPSSFRLIFSASVS